MSFSSRRAAFARMALPFSLLAALTASAAAQETAPAAPPAAEAAKPAAPDPAKVIATIDGKPVTEADLALAQASVDQQYAQLPPEQRRAAAFMAIMEIRLLADKAVAEGLDKDQDFQDHRPGSARPL
jgi:peptidyl-prolyl cis-trans isomerase C